MKIAIIVPITGLTEEDMKYRRQLAKSTVQRGTEFEFLRVEKGPLSIESRYEEELAAEGILQKVKEAERKGYDAAIIWCMGDPALRAAREIVRIPVLGPGETSIMLAHALARKFSVVTPLTGVAQVEEQVKEMDLLGSLASVHPLGIPVLELRRDLNKTKRMITEASKEAMEKHGAGAIVLHCLGMGGLAKEIQDKLGIPVIDPATTGLKFAEMLISLGLSHSKATYPKPPKEND